MKIKNLKILLVITFCSSLAASGNSPTLELIMSETDWMGNAPENPYWSDDGQSIYFQQKRKGNDVRDWYQLETLSNNINKLDAEAEFVRDHRGGAYSQDRKFKLFTLLGDVYQQNMQTGERHRITQTSVNETSPQFITGSNEITFWIGNTAVKLTKQGQLVELLNIEPEQKAKTNNDGYTFLSAQQQRYFITLREKK